MACMSYFSEKEERKKKKKSIDAFFISYMSISKPHTLTVGIYMA